MNTIYGMDVADDNNEYVAVAEKGASIFSEITVPGRFLVELFPWLAHLPSWFPGAGFKNIARAWKEDLLAVRNVAFDAAVENMVRLSFELRLCLTSRSGSTWGSSMHGTFSYGELWKTTRDEIFTRRRTL